MGSRELIECVGLHGNGWAQLDSLVVHNCSALPTIGLAGLWRHRWMPGNCQLLITSFISSGTGHTVQRQQLADRRRSSWHWQQIIGGPPKQKNWPAKKHWRNRTRQIQSTRNLSFSQRKRTNPPTQSIASLIYTYRLRCTISKCIMFCMRHKLLSGTFIFFIRFSSFEVN